MDANYDRFQQRLGRIDRPSAARLPSNVHVRPDGLIVERQPRRLRPGIPWRSIMLAVACFFMLKGFMIWQQGEADYAERLLILQQGGSGEQFAARILSMDPASVWLSDMISTILGYPPQ